jgi:hypothetical protein
VPLDLVHGLEVDLNRVTGASDRGREPLDLGEGCLQTVPLRRVLLTAFGDGERLGEGRVVGPDGKVFDRGAAGEELEFVVVLVSSHNRGILREPRLQGCEGSFLTSSTLPMSSFWGP